MAPANQTLRNIPGPAPLWGWRSGLAAFRRDPVVYLQRLHHDYGDVAAIARTPSPVIAVARPAGVQALFQQDLFRSAALPLVPVGDWTPQQLHIHHDHTQNIVQQMVSRWGVGQPVDMVYVARWLMLRSTIAAFFDTDLPQETLVSLDTSLRTWVVAALASPKRVGAAPPQNSVPKGSAPAKLRAVFTSLLTAAPHPFMRQLFLPEAEVDGTIALVALVYELTALTIGWTMFLVALHAGVADDLVAELRTTLGDVPPTFDQLHTVGELTLLDGVVRESLRVLPAVGVGTRITRVPWQVSTFEVPAEATIVYSPYLLQRMPEFYYAPDRFRPQRWTQIEPVPEAFLPLGVDPLSQLALPLVIAQAKLIVATVLQRYQLVPLAGMQINRARSLLLAPHADIPLVITPLGRAAPRRAVSGDIRDLVYLP